MPESLFTSEQNVIDWLADLNAHYLELGDTPELARVKLQDHIGRLLYFSTGYQYKVEHIPPSHKRPIR